MTPKIASITKDIARLDIQLREIHHKIETSIREISDAMQQDHDDKDRWMELVKRRNELIAMRGQIERRMGRF